MFEKMFLRQIEWYMVLSQIEYLLVYETDKITFGNETNEMILSILIFKVALSSMSHLEH